MNVFDKEVHLKSFVGNEFIRPMLNRKLDLICACLEVPKFNLDTKSFCPAQELATKDGGYEQDYLDEEEEEEEEEQDPYFGIGYDDTLMD